MKFPWTLVALMIGICLLATTQTIAYPPNSNGLTKIAWSSQEEGAIPPRLQALEIPFEVNYSTEIKDLIKSYVTSGYKGTQHILGRATLYFPIFEHYLKINRLPLTLKYLPIVESRLKPSATSDVGAAGLWQFMPSTATEYNLKINRHLDERRNPHRATEAATKMLAELYDQFGDWALVLAAYNCGPTRVRKAIRLANCNNFWELKSYLPRETQKYVPAFIAAAYVDRYYSTHNLVPVYPDLELQDTRTFVVHKYMTFRDLAYTCDLDIETLAYLNPGYRNGIIPTSYAGNILVLPSHATEAFRIFQAELSDKSLASLKAVPYGFFLGTHVVNPGDRIESLARSYHCSIKDIVEWNGLRAPDLFVGQELTLYLSKNFFLPKP